MSIAGQGTRGRGVLKAHKPERSAVSAVLWTALIPRQLASRLLAPVPKCLLGVAQGMGVEALDTKGPRHALERNA